MEIDLADVQFNYNAALSFYTTITHEVNDYSAVRVVCFTTRWFCANALNFY